MDNQTAFWLALTIGGIFAADIFYFNWGIAVIIGQGVMIASEWLAVWHKL